MLKLIPFPYKIAALLLLAGGLFGFGFIQGQERQIRKFEAARLELQQEVFDLADELSEKNFEILRLNQEKQELIHALENEALEAPGSDAPGISSTGGLQRLERRWGTP